MKPNYDVVKRWVNEAQEAVSNDNTMVQVRNNNNKIIIIIIIVIITVITLTGGEFVETRLESLQNFCKRLLCLESFTCTLYFYCFLLYMMSNVMVLIILVSRPWTSVPCEKDRPSSSLQTHIQIHETVS